MLPLETPQQKAWLVFLVAVSVIGLRLLDSLANWLIESIAH